MKVCLVAPTCADSAVPQGGGERYVEELARALAARVETRLVSFGPVSLRDLPKANLERVVLRNWATTPHSPFSLRLVWALRGFDVVHLFQYYSLPTFLAAFVGKRQGSRVFVTDLGGGGWTPASHIDQSRWLDGHLPISEYAARSLPGRPLPHRVVYGGVDLAKFPNRERLDHDGSVVFVGRLLPHKGVHFLVEAMSAERTLHVIGPVADPRYRDELERLAQGKRVEFHHGLPDEEVAGFLRRAMVYVHPTPVDATGSAGAHELLGLAVLEAMACGCPVIASGIASLPEVVEEGAVGTLVEPNSPQLLAKAITALAESPEIWRARSLRARARVESRFTWDTCASAVLAAYAQLGTAVRGAAA